MLSFQFQNYSLELILLLSSILMILSVLASRISSSFGVPSLLLFLGIGMLAGSEGPGQIDFENYSLSFAIGSVCLALIIFDGGMRTSWQDVRPVLRLGVSLSVVGTVITGIVTGFFAHYYLNLSWLEGLILGAIVSSTDAAAVFSILRARNLSLKGGLKQTLEFEAGSNDPIAVLLTIGFLTLATYPDRGLVSLAMLFVTQVGIGLTVGWLGAKGIRLLINNVGIEDEGLYGVLLLSLIIFLFAITSSVNGSGFLAVYVAGLYLSNTEVLHKATMSRFLDGIAWIAQILVFVTLGLLAFPSKLLPLWREGLVLALFMMFIARPLSVWMGSLGLNLKGRERLFVSWIGLRGAAPIILAILPWSVNLPKAEYFFNLVFFVVLFSVMVQGISIPWVAGKLGVTVPMPDGPTAEISAGLLPTGFVSVEIEVSDGAPAVSQRIVDLGLPSGVLLTSLQRDSRYMVPRGDTTLTSGDKIRGLARPSNIDFLKETFGKAKPV